MASVFDIFGSINLETGAFDGALQRSVGRLKAADAALDSTIARSNKLGDTSATVARRYEKLSEQIQVQRNKLLDYALAFEKGEISAKKFAQITASVEKATAGLVSRIKDAKARVDELDATGLTHFQQSIATVVDNVGGKLEKLRYELAATQQAAAAPSSAGGFFRNLSGQQKLNLSYQANDIITGLLSGQSPTMIAAQQGGQIVQILQQAKAGQEGVATASAVAATSQAAFAASSQASVATTASVAASSAATATSMEATAAASTILGASVVSLGAILAAGLITIGAVYKLVKDIEAARKNALAVEVAISKELNEQLLSADKLQKKLQEANDARGLDALGQNGSIPDIQMAIDRLTRERAALDAVVLLEKQKRAGVVSAIKPDAKFAEKFVDEGETEAQRKLKETLDSEIEKLTGQIDALRRTRRDSASEFVQGVGARTAKEYQEQLKNQYEAEKKLEEHKKKILDKAKDDAKKFADEAKKAREAVVGIFASTTDNQLTKAFLAGEDAVQRMHEALKGMNPDLQKILADMLRSQAASKAFGIQMDNALKSLDLRRDAGQFIPNQLSNLWEGDYLQKQLQAIGAAGPITQYFDKEKLAAIDKQVIKLTEPFLKDPSKLTYAQNKLASDARLREADRIDNEKEEDRKTREELVKVLKQLNGNKALQIDITDPANRTTIGGTSSNVNARYPAR